MNIELIEQLVKKFEASHKSIDTIVTKMEELFGVIEKLNDATSAMRSSGKIDEIQKAALSISDISGKCESTLLSVSDKTDELSNNAQKVGAIVATHNSDISKSIESFNCLVASIKEFNDYIRPNIDEIGCEIKSLSDLSSLTSLVSAEIKSLKNSVDVNNETMRDVLKANIAFNQIYEKMHADSTTFRQTVEQITQEWSDVNLAKNAFKGHSWIDRFRSN